MAPDTQTLKLNSKFAFWGGPDGVRSSLGSSSLVLDPSKMGIQLQPGACYYGTLTLAKFISGWVSSPAAWTACKKLKPSQPSQAG